MAKKMSGNVKVHSKHLAGGGGSVDELGPIERHKHKPKTNAKGGQKGAQTSGHIDHWELRHAAKGHGKRHAGAKP